MLAGLFDAPPDMNNSYWTRWQELTNSKLNIEWVDANSFIDAFNVRLSAGDLPEVAAIYDINPVVKKAIADGVFYDLTDLLGDFSKYPNLKNNVPPDCWANITTNGRIYSLPRNRSSISSNINIRRDWLDALNIPVPTTLDEYADALAQIVQADADGNGAVDSVGLLAHLNRLPYTSFQSGFGCLDGKINPDGTQYHPFFTDEFIDMIEYFKGMWDTGALYHEYITLDQSSANDLANTNRAASWNVSIFENFGFEQNAAKIQPDPVPYYEVLNLQGPAGYALDMGVGFAGGFFLRADLSEEQVLRYLDYFEASTSKEIGDMGYWGIEGVHHTVAEDGSRQFTELGLEEVNITARGVGCLGYEPWGEVDNAGASAEYNEIRRASTALYEENAKVDYWDRSIIYSPTWSDMWPQYQQEFHAEVHKAVSGQITMEEFIAYHDEMRKRPEFVQAFTEFAESSKLLDEAKARG